MVNPSQPALVALTKSDFRVLRTERHSLGSIVGIFSEVLLAGQTAGLPHGKQFSDIAVCVCVCVGMLLNSYHPLCIFIPEKFRSWVNKSTMNMEVDVRESEVIKM